MRISGHIQSATFTSARTRATLPGDDITAETVAVMLKIKPSTVADWARRGIIPSYKIGKFRHYSRGDILTWIERNRDGTTSDHS